MIKIKANKKETNVEHVCTMYTSIVHIHRKKKSKAQKENERKKMIISIIVCLYGAIQSLSFCQLAMVGKRSKFYSFLFFSLSYPFLYSMLAVRLPLYKHFFFMLYSYAYKIVSFDSHFYCMNMRYQIHTHHTNTRPINAKPIKKKFGEQRKK